MNLKNYSRRSLWIMLIASVWGCAGSLATFKTLPSSAYFEADAKEQEALRIVSRAQESRRANCQQSVSCEEVSYTRGLVALFENREDAIHAFQELNTTTPNGPYAASSARWLSLLQGGQLASARQSPLFMQLRQEILRGLLEPDTLAASRRVKEQERR
nr:hypothetical protein [Nitrospira sp.]